MPHNLRCFFFQGVGSVFVQPDGNGKIRDGQFFHDIQNEEGHLVCNFVSVRIYTRQNNILIMLRVSCPDGGIGSDPFATFDKKGGQQFSRFIFRQQAV